VLPYSLHIRVRALTAFGEPESIDFMEARQADRGISSWLSSMTPELREYRKEQVAKANAGQSDYDKLVVALSGGALGLSFTFLKDVANGQASSHTGLLLAAWGCWGLSVAFTLVSIYTGVEALRETVRQVDRGTIYKEKPGRKFDKLTSLLNPGAGLLFIFGLVFMIAFVYFNPYGRRYQGPEARPATQDTTMTNRTTKPRQSPPVPGPRPDDPPPPRK